MARWEEIDLDAQVWTIPAARTKISREHRLPLCHRAARGRRGLGNSGAITAMRLRRSRVSRSPHRAALGWRAGVELRCTAKRGHDAPHTDGAATWQRVEPGDAWGSYPSFLDTMTARATHPGRLHGAE